MASFKDALQALAHGTLKAEVLLDHIERVLSRKPELLHPIIAQLSEAYASGVIEAQTFAKLQAHARRTAGASEPSSPSGEPQPAVELSNAANSPVAPEVEEGPAAETIRTVLKQEVLDALVYEDELDLDLTAASMRASLDSSQPSAEEAANPAGPQPLALGSVLKERFMLDEVLGVGGMGTVYKGRDLLKVEARDKNPHIALKVLNEDFKKHPDAFIALQREASRQQRLAHPNIATVYDFDRTGSTVFVTMELLEGQPLNTYIRKVVRPKGGLPFSHAFSIIRGLGQALGYAHERDIVHSDFKPANCFLTKSGTVKVLDFGIARVVKRQEDTETTLFDPRKFGALTPAYASTEMLNNCDPDPRDDIYALACVAYELLCGRHPFDKKSAIQARDRKMAPAPVKGLTRSQMHALTRALAFTREERTATVQEFLEQLEGKRRRSPRTLLIAGALLAAIILAALLFLAAQRALAPIDSSGDAPAPASAQ